MLVTVDGLVFMSLANQIKNWQPYLKTSNFLKSLLPERLSLGQPTQPGHREYLGLGPTVFIQAKLS